MLNLLKECDMEGALRADFSNGMAVCPRCRKVLAQPIERCGRIAVWCRRCRENIVIEYGKG